MTAPHVEAAQVITPANLVCPFCSGTLVRNIGGDHRTRLAEFLTCSGCGESFGPWPEDEGHSEFFWGRPGAWLSIQELLKVRILRTPLRCSTEGNNR